MANSSDDNGSSQIQKELFAKLKEIANIKYLFDPEDRNAVYANRNKTAINPMVQIEVLPERRNNFVLSIEFNSKDLENFSYGYVQSANYEKSYFCQILYENLFKNLAVLFKDGSSYKTSNKNGNLVLNYEIQIGVGFGGGNSTPENRFLSMVSHVIADTIVGNKVDTQVYEVAEPSPQLTKAIKQRT